MHNHLIQLGRKIAEDSGIISYLWDQTENMNIAKLQQKLNISSVSASLIQASKKLIIPVLTNRNMCTMVEFFNGFKEA